MTALPKRCYVCRSPFDENVEECAHQPGLCDECDSRSAYIQQWLANRSECAFDADYFLQPNVDYPVWNPRCSCKTCGVVGHCYSWNQWHVGDDAVDTDLQAQGDGYRACTNCETLTITPWSESQHVMSLASASIATPSAWTGGKTGQNRPIPFKVGSHSVLLIEMLLLFVAALAVAAAIL